MITTNDLRRGVVIEVDDILYTVVEFQHVKPGKGPAFVRTKLKEVHSGKVIDRTWRAGEKVRDVRIERRPFELLYRTEDGFVIMDPVSFEQIVLDETVVGDAARYLVDNSRIDVLFNGSEPISIEPPTFVDLVIVTTDPGLKGDTASGGSKPATLETGLVVQIPLFVREGEKVRIDTRTETYVERVKS
jgi:elongation factor P